jgi:hypothetical protein
MIQRQHWPRRLSSPHATATMFVALALALALAFVVVQRSSGRVAGFHVPCSARSINPK